MAKQFYVTIEGAKQGKFKGEIAGSLRTNACKGLAFHYELKSPTDLASGQLSGKRQHSPITFVKEWGASTPQIFQAATTNELLKTVLFEFTQTTASGEEQTSYTIKLTNASVASVSHDLQGPPPGGTADTHDLEEVSLVFQKIEIVDVPGGVIASDETVAPPSATRTTPPPATVRAGGGAIMVGQPSTLVAAKTFPG
jgi:type VI secretion system secreted protein Hcp